MTTSKRNTLTENNTLIIDSAPEAPAPAKGSPVNLEACFIKTAKKHGFSIINTKVFSINNRLFSFSSENTVNEKINGQWQHCTEMINTRNKWIASACKAANIKGGSNVGSSYDDI